MITRLASSSTSHQDSEEKPVYNVVIIYENAATGKRANCFCENLIRDLGEATLGIKDLWSFKVLDIPHVRDAAAEAAAMADVVILGLDGHAELPDGIKGWMEQWIGQVAMRADERSPILIALFGASGDEREAASPTRTFLGALTETAGLPFLHTIGKAVVKNQPGG